MGKSAARKQTRNQSGYVANPSNEDRMLANSRVKLDNGPLQPKNDTQRKYINAIRHNTVVVTTGPAGTGKTYVAVRSAAMALASGEIDKIYITRPMIEACDEEPDLGALPGELHLRLYPIFMAQMSILEDFFGKSFVEYLIKIGKIELVPLSLLRGRSISNAWVLATEMQNASVGTMKLLLTRIGENAKLLIDGDVTQKDIKVSGLDDLMTKLDATPIVGVTQIEFTWDEVVRSGVCKAFLELYK